ncbi:hypothetical protein EJ06DRAFT_518109 [Trichodelitschia bisporula]|uniref:Uncharacterized protein n=1 Tax=Trichodelitschia bisporula TaxID=703511 RepID=A0A6G1IAF6_9PEZI|nr:hypothetical protein EJ06DRAFT_518109 [Trichodelitschia bisporula]
MASHTIPLLCNICPKKPTFSDVSHLLTHIASKGHLSHYYKLKVRSGSEAEARVQLNIYDQWYEQWGVEQLMSDRMSLKEKKRPRTRLALVLTGEAPSRTPSSSYSVQQAAPQRTQSRVTTNSRPTPSGKPSPLPSFFDPRLVDPVIKTERHATPPLQTVNPNIPLQYQPSRLSQSMQNNPYLANGGGFGFSATNRPDSGRRTPLTARELYIYGDPTPQQSLLDTVGDTAECDDGNDDETFIKTPSPPIADEETCGETDASRLKGVFWPGMSIFDSATLDARRRRNQKKDASIVEQLEINSQVVEADERVFTPRGTLKKIKRISGMVDEDSSPMGSPTEEFRATYIDVELPSRRPSTDVKQDYDPYEGGFDELDQLYSARFKRRRFSGWEDSAVGVGLLEQDSVDRGFGPQMGMEYLQRGFDYGKERPGPQMTTGQQGFSNAFERTDAPAKSDCYFGYPQSQQQHQSTGAQTTNGMASLLNAVGSSSTSAFQSAPTTPHHSGQQNHNMVPSYPTNANTLYPPWQHSTGVPAYNQHYPSNSQAGQHPFSTSAPHNPYGLGSVPTQGAGSMPPISDYALPNNGFWFIDAESTADGSAALHPDLTDPRLTTGMVTGPVATNTGSGRAIKADIPSEGVALEDNDDLTITAPPTPL